MQPHSTRTVISADGTPIGYHQLGHGPGLVLVHGTMETALSHLDLAQELASDFTVYLYDRRGRANSGSYGQHYSPAAEVQDLTALLQSTGARQVFGISLGALVCLQTAIDTTLIDRAVIYEPPLFLNGTAPMALIDRYERELAQGNTAAALITAMKAAQMGPAFFNALPRWLAEFMTSQMIKSEDRKAQPGAATMRALAPTLHYDLNYVLSFADQLHRFRAVQADVLLLGGTNSPAYLQQSVASLATVLPHATLQMLPGLDHGSSGNRNFRGRPDVVANAMRPFFSAAAPPAPSREPVPA